MVWTRVALLCALIVLPIACAADEPVLETQTRPILPAGQTEVVVLRRRTELSGRALHADGRPASARIRLTALETNESLGGGGSGADGRFTVGAPGGIPLRVEATVRAPAARHGKGGRSRPVEHGVIQVTGSQAGAVTIRLRELDQERTLDVLVLDVDGEPVPGAEVDVDGAMDQRSDEEGRTRFTGLPEWKTSVGARSRSSEKLMVRPADLEVVPAGQEVVLRFRRAIPLSGRALLPDGTPARGATMKAFTPDGVWSHAKTDDAGRFRVAALPGEPHMLWINLPTGGRLEYVYWRSGVTPGEDPIEVRLELFYP